MFQVVRDGNKKVRTQEILVQKYDLIKIIGGKKIKSFNYKIPTDISSCAFFIFLTALSNNSQIKIKNVNMSAVSDNVLNLNGRNIDI